jgi:TolB-like protein/DNA-binding winged helix-turn-helix (wHTH) protein
MELRGGFKLGDWTVLPLEGRLSRDAESRSVRPKAMDVLLVLAEAGGDVVERDDLLRQVWGERAVSDEPLTRCIGELRGAFGDSRSDPAFILTIPKRGYRLLETPEPLVNEEPVAAEPAPLAEAPVAPRKSDGGRKPVMVLAVLVVVAIAGMTIQSVLDRRPGEEAPQVAPAAMERSIAVLPFADMSAEQDQEYMGDGVAEEVLNLLTRIPELRVISRSSTFSLKGSSIDVREVAQRFNVSYLLEGSVRRAEDRVRVTVQLIDGRTEAHVWSETYDRELQDIFDIQDEIAQAVVSRLQLTILGDAPTSRPTDPEAYALFLQARYLSGQPAGDAMQRSIDYYKAALEIDPDYVPAWVWLAATYDDTVNSLDIPRDEVVRLAQEAIRTALEIDPDDPLALGMSAVLTSAWDDDLASAAAQMQRAVDADPGNPILLRWTAIVLTDMGRHDDAVRVAEYLFDRDPVGNISKINLASIYLNAGRYADAASLCEIEVALTDVTSPCGSRLIQAYLHTEEPESARALLEQRKPGRVYTRLAPVVFHALGDQAEFEQALADLQDAYEAGDSGLAYWIAYAWAYAGDADAMFAWLEEAWQDGALSLAPGEAIFDRYMGDPRWVQLMERMGKSPEDLAAIQFAVPPLI